MPSSETNIEEKAARLLFFKHIVRKVFLEDWHTKLVALAITLALWVGVTGLSTPTTRRISDIPLTLSYSTNTEITNSSAQAVSIVISGDKRKINQITENEVLISLDLSDLPAGERLVQLQPSNVLNLPLGVKVQEIQPNKIQIRLEAVEEKEIPVKIETQGDLPDGLEVYSETANPARVKVRGPASYIRTLMSVSTDKIDIGDKQTDFSVRQIPLSLSNTKANVLESVVDVTFRIGEKRVEKMFMVPVSGTNKRAQVVLFGGRSLLDDVSSSHLKVDVSGDNDKPNVQLPPSLEGKVEVRRVKLN